MDQPALDRRLGTVGANPPCCFRTATHLGHAFIKDIAGNAGDKPLQPTFPDKGGRLRSLLFFTLQRVDLACAARCRAPAAVWRAATCRLGPSTADPVAETFGGPSPEWTCGSASRCRAGTPPLRSRR